MLYFFSVSQSMNSCNVEIVLQFSVASRQKSFRTYTSTDWLSKPQLSEGDASGERRGVPCVNLANSTYICGQLRPFRLYFSHRLSSITKRNELSHLHFNPILQIISWNSLSINIELWRLLGPLKGGLFSDVSGTRKPIVHHRAPIVHREHANLWEFLYKLRMFTEGRKKGVDKF